MQELKQRWPIIALLMFFSGCAQNKPHFFGPGHDADWPIEAPDEEIYSDVLQAEQLSGQGNVDESIAKLEEALRIDPKAAHIHVRLAQEWVRKGNLEKAEQHSISAIQLDPQQRNAHYLLGRIYSARKEWDRAEGEFKIILNSATDLDEDAIIGLTTVFVESKRPEKAVDLLKGLVADSPHHYVAFYYLGRVYSEMNRMDDAVQAYEKAAAVNPGFSPALKAIALLYEYQGKKDEAINVLVRALETDVDNSSLRSHLGQLYLEKNDLDRALAQFEIVARDHPEDFSARLRVGLIYLRKESFVEAKNILTALAKDSPDLPRVRYYLGITLERLGDTSGAMKQLKSVSSDSDIYIDARMALASVQESAGDFKAAEQTLRSTLEKQPDSTPILASLTGLLAKRGQGGQALALLDAAVKKSPKDETLWFALGEVHDKLGNFDKVVSSMRTVLELNPDNANALNYLGYTFAEKGLQLDEAEQLIQRALLAKPKDGYITDSLGWVYFKKGDYAKAVEKLDEATKYAPSDPTILEHLGDALEKVGNLKRAREAYELSLKNAKEESIKKRVREKLQKLAP